MPLVANTDLPAFARLEREGETVLPGDEAVKFCLEELKKFQ